MTRLTSVLLCGVLFSLTLCANAYMTKWPVTGTITNKSHTYNGSSYYAVDIGAPLGRRVDTCHRGIATRHDLGSTSYGKYITMAHHDNYVSYYCHLSLMTAANGGEYWVGDKIGEVGSTGNSTGNHLHFEMRHNGVTQSLPGSVGSTVTIGTDLKDFPGI